MVKTPEEYFQDQDFDLPVAGKGESLTPAEQAFFHKYVGMEGAKALGIEAPQDGASTAPAPVPVGPPLHEELKDAPNIQMIFFCVQGQVYTIPIDAVQEVIRYVTPTSLPLAPRYVAGVMNLRGRVTPLLHVEQMISNTVSGKKTEGFIVICMRNGLQVGLIVERIDNMYTVTQDQIIWNVESQIGANAEFLCGILDYNDKIYGIVSIDMIVEQVIQS